MKRFIITLALSLFGVFAFAQSVPPVTQDLQKQIEVLDRRVSDLEERINELVGQNERLRKVADFGKPLTEFLDSENGVSHKLLSLEGDARRGDLTVTLRIEALEKSCTIQFGIETHLVDLYGEAYPVEDVEIAGQDTRRWDLEKGVPVVAKLFFKELPVEKVSEIKLLQYEDIGNFHDQKIQFLNLSVTWK